jgi:hypothetical protein
MTKNRRRRGGRVRQSMDFGITLSRFLSVRLSGVPSIVACLQVGGNLDLAVRWWSTLHHSPIRAQQLTPAHGI